MLQWATSPLGPIERMILRAMLYGNVIGLVVGLPLMIASLVK